MKQFQTVYLRPFLYLANIQPSSKLRPLTPKFSGSAPANCLFSAKSIPFAVSAENLIFKNCFLDLDFSSKRVEDTYKL